MGLNVASYRGILVVGRDSGVDAVDDVVVGGVVVTGFVPIFLSSCFIVFVPVLEVSPGNELPLLSATTGVTLIKPMDTSRGKIFVS